MTGPLVPIFCGSTACASAPRGRPRVLGKWRPAPGAAVETLPCKWCKHVTRLTVLPDGSVQTLVRRPVVPQAA